MSSTVIFERHNVKAKAPRSATIPSVNGPTSSPVRSSVSSKTVHCFVDYSNLFVNARKVASELSTRILFDGTLGIDFGNLRTLAQRNRKWGSGFAAAGLDNGDRIRRESARADIRFEVYELGKGSNKEQGIDRIIQCRMRELADQRAENQVVVLISGDGNGHARGQGFLPTLQSLYDKGFEVEVASWNNCLNATLRYWAEHHGRVLELDRFFNALTYEPGRPALGNLAFGRQMISTI